MSLKKVRALLNFKKKGYADTTASSFTSEDMKALKVNFKPSAENEVIPDVKVINFPKEYEEFVLPNINKHALRLPDFNVGKLEVSNHLRSFIDWLHIAETSQEVIGTRYSSTDSLVNELCHKLWSELLASEYQVIIAPKLLSISYSVLKIHFIKSFCSLFFDKSDKYENHIQVHPEIVIEKKDIARLAIETDKQLKDIGPMTNFGETQITAELLVCAYMNINSTPMDQTIFFMRIISTYVTFYKAVISEAYWKELIDGLPQEQSVVVQRWPRENGLRTGLDLTEPDERRAILTALVKIRQHILLVD
ncbi:4235_t:CDS:2 [Funneliformis mosseae]|uniref:4235_t:CDS:1 n=1 Tax=Funneliformis mosseae TaxID=27381 RepID=A0A9N9CGY6_FUNMO|nr:4235_t:CDS:2 [Funneliformis mosseae]